MSRQRLKKNDLVVSCSNFTNLPFYGFTASSSSRCRALIDTLRLYEFTILRLYHLLLSTLSTKNNNWIYQFTLLPWFPSPSHLLYEFTVLRFHTFTTFSCLCYTHRTWICEFTVLLRFPALAHAFHDFMHLQCASVGSSLQHWNIFHRWCYAVRSSLNCWQDWSYTPRSSFQL